MESFGFHSDRSLPLANKELEPQAAPPPKGLRLLIPGLKDKAPASTSLAVRTEAPLRGGRKQGDHARQWSQHFRPGASAETARTLRVWAPAVRPRVGGSGCKVLQSLGVPGFLQL